MPDPARSARLSVLWTLTAPPHETVTCSLRLTPAGWRLRVNGLRVPLEWLFFTEGDARRRASTMQRDLTRLGWEPADGPAPVAASA